MEPFHDRELERPYGGTYSGTYFECPKKCLRTSLKSWEMFLESSRIWCTKIMTWKKHLSSQIRPQKLKSDQEQQQQQQQQTYVKDPKQECSRSKRKYVY